jgi:hypothetical protein
MAVDRIFVMANPAKTRKENATGVFKPLRAGQVALIEEHPFHPYDEVAGVNRVFIVQGDPPCEAYLSEAVQEKLLQNQLVQMSKSDATARYNKMTGNDYAAPAEHGDEPHAEEEELEATEDFANKSKTSKKSE